MKQIFLFVVVLLSISAFGQKHRNCGTPAAMQHLYQADPSLKNRILQNEVAIAKWIKNNPTKNYKSVITIPIVVHVIYNTSNQNISDAQIQSQIDVLNQDYRRLNADTANTPSDFKSVAADVQIEFCFAHQDPNGNWTNGVTRTQTNKSVFDLSLDDAKFTSQGGVDIWDRNKYLNIWVVPGLKDGAETGILGYAQFPGGPASTDGVVISYRYFGTMGTVQYPYNKGRTATHELGHWFGLYHIWGDDGTSCSGSDDVADTPNQAGENYGCPTYPSPSCNNTSDMFMNYMDYTNDACMNMFTLGQKQRMWSFINNNRVSLKTSDKCTVVSIDEMDVEKQLRVYPNPSNGTFTIDFSDNKISGPIELKVYNSLGQLVFEQDYSNISKQKKIALSNSPAGIYMLHIKTADFNLVRKIEIHR